MKKNSEILIKPPQKLSKFAVFRRLSLTGPHRFQIFHVYQISFHREVRRDAYFLFMFIFLGCSCLTCLIIYRHEVLCLSMRSYWYRMQSVSKQNTIHTGQHNLVSVPAARSTPSPSLFDPFPTKIE